jgi:Domain of unknown function (DUF4276)
MRLIFVVEGHTEEDFVNTVLVSHLANMGVYATVTKVGLGEVSGGLPTYDRLLHHLLNLIRGDRNIWITTMIDFFRIPTDCPGYLAAKSLNARVDQAKAIEQSMLTDIISRTNSSMLIPYVQLHEFEALLWTSPETLDEQMVNQGKPSRLTELRSVLENYETPEHINDGPETAPSKRLQKMYDGAYKKRVIGPLVTNNIGLERLRQACPRFGAWVTQLENLA